MLPRGVTPRQEAAVSRERRIVSNLGYLYGASAQAPNHTQGPRQGQDKGQGQGQGQGQGGLGMGQGQGQGQDKTDQTRPDQTRPDRTRQTRPDETRRDHTRQTGEMKTDRDRGERRRDNQRKGERQKTQESHHEDAHRWRPWGQTSAPGTSRGKYHNERVANEVKRRWLWEQSAAGSRERSWHTDGAADSQAGWWESSDASGRSCDPRSHSHHRGSPIGARAGQHDVPISSRRR